MKFSALLAPVVFLSTVTAWGKEDPSSDYHSINPAKNRRYDYKQSLKKPFLFNGALPFWGHHGNTFVAQDFIRLAPSVPGLRGSVWRSSPSEYKEWEVEFSFKAYGQSHVGGRGLAFWYTQERAIEGGVFGSKDKWKGLGVFLDTSDPLNHRLNSMIYGIENDGSKSFPSNPVVNNFGGCLRDYKNSAVPVVIRVSYIGKTLRVAADTYSKGAKMITCFERDDISLPIGYHFGLSAESAETGSPDDHDLYSFEVYEVNPPEKTKKYLRPHEAEMIRKGEEVKVNQKDREVFEEVQKIVQQEEEKMKEESDGPSPLTSAQIAATVGDTQFRIIESLNTIHKKLESLGAPMQPQETTAKNLADLNGNLVSVVASLQAMEHVVQGMVDHIMMQGGLRDTPDLSSVLKEELKTINTRMEDMDVRQANQHQLTHARLIDSKSWLAYVIFLVIVQAMALSGYNWYKKKLEWSQKKFI